MASFAAAEKFLAKHLKGRHQEDMTPDVAQRLKEITVDVKTVEMPRRVDAAASALKPAAPLQPGEASYKAGIEMAGQSMTMTMKSEIKDDSGAWVVTETTQTPAGPAIDTSVLDKESLTLKKRAIKQGPIEINYEIKENKISGTMSMGGQQRPIAADSGGAIFAEGTAGNAAIVALPLAEGYTGVFRSFDVQQQKIAVKQLKVVSVEKVTVPAGAFEAFVVEITSAEGNPGSTTLWIAKDSRKVVKIVSIVPQLNGAKVTAELTN
jgi:hypothetical protein